MLATRFLPVLAAVAVAVGVPAGASAAPVPPTPSPWQAVTGDTGTSLTQLQSARSADGALHSVWVAPSASDSNKRALYERTQSATGVLGPVHTLLDGQDGLTNPAIAVNPAGTVWVYGAGSGTLGGGVFAITTTDGFATWSAPNSISTYGYAYAAYGLGAVFSPTGAAYETFGRTVKLGNEIASVEDDFGTAAGLDAHIDGGCCTYWSQPAVDGLTGGASVAWYSNVSDRAGLEVMDLTSGVAQYVPDSADAERHGSSNGDMQTPITGRLGQAGTYVGYCGGYPTCNRVLVWRVGAPKPMTIAKAGSVDLVRVTAGPDGRLWTMWISQHELWATRSNTTATAWGAPVRIPLSSSADDAVWKLTGEGSRGWLDAFVSQERGSGHDTTTVRVRPGLTLALPAKAWVGSSVTAKVTDAGAPVAGAKVRIGLVSYTTNAGGVATVKLPATKGARTVTASATGYTKALGGIVVRKH